jgi:E1A/CREB-binding protein
LDINFKHASQIAYFEGDFWPKAIEENIKELEQEEAEKRQREEVENGLDLDEMEVETTECTDVRFLLISVL